MRAALVVTLAVVVCGCSTWRERQTEHLVIHYRPGSYAERNIEEASELYEGCYRSLEERIPGYSAHHRFHIYLHEDLGVAGRVNRFTGSLHYQYSKAFRVVSAHEMMHVALGEVNPRAPGGLEEGLCRYFESRYMIQDGERYESALYRYAALEPESSWRIEQVFQRGDDGAGNGNVAAAFVAYLVKQLGTDGFWRFYRKVTVTNHRRLLSETLGRNPTEINAGFARFVNALDPPPAPLRAFR